MQPYNSSQFYQYPQQQYPQQQQPQAQPPRFVYYPAANVPAAAAPVPIQAAYHPNLAVTVPLQQQSATSAQPSQEQQQQQQQQFDYEMLPNSKQLEAEEEDREKEDATKRLVKPVQGTFQQPQPTVAAAPQAQPQPQQSFMYPPTQYMMAQQPQPAMPVQPQPQTQQQPFVQQVPTANMQPQQQQQQQMHNPQCHHCHCRHRRMHLRKGLHFKILIVMQLCIAVIFTCMVPHLLPLLFDALFVFGLVMAIIQNVPGLIVFNVGNVFAVILSTWAFLVTILATLSGHVRSDVLIVDLLFLVITVVQWLSFISGIHYTVRIAKKRHTNTNTNTNAFPGQPQPQQFQPQQLQPQQVMMTNTPTNVPGFQYPPVQQAQQAV